MKENKVIKFLLNPPTCFIILTIILTLVFCISSIILVCLGLTAFVLSYVIYAFAGVTLSYAMFLIVKYSPRLKAQFLEFLKSKKFTRELLENYGYRTAVTTLVSLILNVLFGLFEITMSAISLSIWYGALGLYHIILSFTRLGILQTSRKKFKQGLSENKYKLGLYKRTGVCIILLNLALSGAIVQMMFSQRAFMYVGLMIYAMAAFAFYKITIAIVGLVKAKRTNNLSTEAFKNLNVVDGIVSIYALQTALIATFSTPETDMSYMNLITGVVVVILTIGLGALMIIKSNKLKKKLKENEDGRQEI